MSRSSRVLVLGARGMLGSHVMAAFREDPLGALVEHSGPRFSVERELIGYLSAQAPTTVVNCTGYTGEYSVEHFKVNAGFPRTIANYCAKVDALFIQVSTNAVFPADDERLWLPCDPTSPRTLYETSKAMGEDPRAYVLRCSFIGANRKDVGLLDALREGRPYADRKWNGVTALCLARRIVRIARTWDGKMTQAMEHVHSPRVATIAELAEILGSRSQPAQRRMGKLLGGGRPMPDLRDQLAEYVRWVEQGLARAR